MPHVGDQDVLFYELLFQLARFLSQSVFSLFQIILEGSSDPAFVLQTGETKGIGFPFILSDLLSSLSDLDFKLFLFCSNMTAYPVWIVYAQCFTLVLIH